MQDMIMHCLINPSTHINNNNNNNLSMENFFHLHSEAAGCLSSEAWPNSLYDPIHPTQEEDVMLTPTSTTTNSTQSLQASSKDKTTKKRKAVDKSPMVSDDEENKRMKVDHDNVDKKPDYIHVRARRGQATDSHSLAERVRRERISERMKYLQGLVPGCDKITGKAGMLDEIINYVQSLQRQVEFLSMKLAAVNPRLDCNMDNIFTKEMNMAAGHNMSAIGISFELQDPSFLPFNSLQQVVASDCGLDMSMITPELALGRSASAPAASPPEPYLDATFQAQRSSPGWDNGLHDLYGSALQFQSVPGNILPNLKREM